MHAMVNLYILFWPVLYVYDDGVIVCGGPWRGFKFSVRGPQSHRTGQKNYVWIYHGMHWPPSYRSKLSNTLKSKDLAFQKIPDTPTKTIWSQISDRSAYPLQNYVCFSPSPLDWRFLAINVLPLTGPGLRPTLQNSSQHENGRGLECRKVTF